MDQIIVMFAPFDLVQNIVVYKNGEVVDNLTATIDTITNTIDAAATRYNINNINLCGSTDYLKRFKNELSNSKYEHRTINII